MKNSAIIRFVIFSCWLLTSQAYAAGYGLIEQSASAGGNAYAGGAASAEDASTVYQNPAGMTYLPDNQLVIGAHAILPSASFNNNGSTTAFGAGTTGNNGGDAGDLTFIPNFYLTNAITPDIRIGLGINVPFGLKTEYDSDWVGRYQAIKSELKTTNINPSVAFKANDQLSLGFGILAMRAEASLSSAVDFGTLCTGLGLGCGTPQSRDGVASIHGDGWGIGWNTGAIWQINNATRLGLAYRSQVHLTLDGNIGFSNVPSALATSFPNGNISAKLTTPDSLSASLFHQLNEEWDLLADITWVGWKKFKNLTVVRDSGSIAADTAENWSNTIRLAFGANYHYNQHLKLRTGIAYDESPVSDTYRTPRIPDNDRYWLSAGANYKLSDDNSIDIAYSHVFVKETTLNKTNDASVSALKDTLRGAYDNQVDVFSLQFVHSF
ncbi:OmpP1/FadL family transporter [Methyloradius palustris]|uniref:Aromatic hydrocarbon degradation protein n=1 Tax=Methyloradius palustris TaxID=2778876 RepID=A0A8D5JWA5_9PROT|nr:outer membrane protein transport protein [Methyloradius palustris]BCM24899.1 aromatic hydrocarbon degradation protein [Methyloradius palustris]